MAVLDLLHDAQSLTGFTVGALLGVTTKWLADRWSERSRRGHERAMRFLDTATQAAVEFLAAAEWAARAQQARLMAGRSMDNANRPDNQQSYDQYRHRYEQVTEEAQDSFKRAEIALTTLYLLTPKVAEAANAYLDLCKEADIGKDDTRQDERQQARTATESTARRELGVRL